MIYILAAASILLTSAMFATKKAMLGFPCAIFWALTGAFFYQHSTATWDIEYTVFIACLLGMTPFSMLAAYGLREKRDTIADVEMERGEGGYIDERGARQSKKPQDSEENLFGDDGMPDTELDEEYHRPSQRTSRLRERVKARRTGTTRRGEFNW